MTMTTTETTTTQLDQLRHVTAAVTALVEHATPDQLLQDSPCVGWSGHDVLNHMVGSAGLFTGPARGEEVPFPDWSAMPDWLGADPARSHPAEPDHRRRVTRRSTGRVTSERVDDADDAFRDKRRPRSVTWAFFSGGGRISSESVCRGSFDQMFDLFGRIYGGGRLMRSAPHRGQ